MEQDDRNPGYTVHSSHCPQNHVSSPHTNTTWNGQCTYQHCLSLLQFVEDLHIVHQKGMQNELNAHIKPQSRVCFKDGATPEKWDRVATGYEQAAISELGRHLGAKLNTESDNKHGSSHSTSDAMLDGAPFKVTNSVLNILEHLTQEEDRMLRRFYGHTKSRLMGKELTHYHEEEAGKALADHNALHCVLEHNVGELVERSHDADDFSPVPKHHDQLLCAGAGACLVNALAAHELVEHVRVALVRDLRPAPERQPLEPFPGRA